MSTTGPILQARNLFKTYRLGRVAVPVLKGVGFTVARGEWVSVLGASGSGKSTLLHLLGALDRHDHPTRACAACGYPTEGLKSGRCPECGNASAGELLNGEIRYNDRSIDAFSARELNAYHRQAVGFVFQFYHLFPELSVLENVLIASMVLHGRLGYARRRGQLRDDASAMLDRVGLGHRLKHRPVELSGGERQRVAIARALVNKPAVLLADEPTGNLDRKTGDAIIDLLGESHTRDGRTIVMVTHDAENARRADRIVRIEDGRIVAND